VLLYGGAEALRGTVPDWGAVLTTADSPGTEGSVVLRRADCKRRPIVLRGHGRMSSTRQPRRSTPSTTDGEALQALQA
jgi:hypothetical protein